MDKQGKIVKSITNGASVLSSASEEDKIEEGIYDVEFAPQNNPVKKIRFEDINITENQLSLGIDDVPESAITEKEFIEVYAIDPAGINFTDAVVTVTAKGTSLYKCSSVFPVFYKWCGKKPDQKEGNNCSGINKQYQFEIKDYIKINFRNFYKY